MIQIQSNQLFAASLLVAGDIQFLVIPPTYRKEGLRIVGLWVCYKSSALGWKRAQSGGCLEAQRLCDCRCGVYRRAAMLWWVRDVQSKRLSPNRVILGNMIRQWEEVRVREKCSGFMLVIEGVSIVHHSFRILPGHVLHLDHTLSELQKIGE